MQAPFKNDTPILPQAVGNAYLNELIADSEGRSKFLPHPVGLRDMDKSLLEMLREGELSTTGAGSSPKPVPVSWQHSERSGARALNWQLLGVKDQNQTLPLITLLRGSELPGTLYGTKSVIPQNQSYTYVNIPTFKDQQRGTERWRIPQPTPIDVPYTVTMVARYTRELNPFIERFVRAFASLQLFLPVNGHAFPLTLREGDKDGTMEEIEGDRYYLKNYTLLLQGYLLDEMEYTRVEARNRNIILLEANEEQLARLDTKGTVRILRRS
jgi:hypothetical protein